MYNIHSNAYCSTNEIFILLFINMHLFIILESHLYFLVV